MANPIIKIKRGSGAPISLQAGELAMDLQNSSLFVGTANGPVAIGGSHTFATKTFVNDAVAAEADLRSAADATLTSNLNAEISRAQGAESDLADDIAAETSARQSAISSAVSTLEAADLVLDGKITTEKGRIDAILALSDSDKDSLKEIVDLIQSIDTENDATLAGYVTSNNAALATEVTNRTNADTALGVRIDGVETAATALTGRVSAAEQDIIDEETARIAAVSAETSARQSAVSTLEAADETLQDNIDAEASTRSTADTSLSNRITTLENASADTRLTDLEADVADHETRISALETTIDGGSY